MVKIYCAYFFLLIILLPRGSDAEAWGPWSISTDAPAILGADQRKQLHVRPARESMSAVPFLLLLSFYQKVIGPANAGRCPMYPTCSQYSVQAIRKHGPFIGIMMTADRLIHEIDEQKYAPLIMVGKRHRFSDPVENNDFWWYRE